MFRPLIGRDNGAGFTEDGWEGFSILTIGMTRDALPPDADFNEMWPNLGVEAVAVHTQVARCIPEADQSRRDTAVLFHGGLHCVECVPVVDHSVCVFRK